MTLQDFFDRHPRVAIAFSGGADSAYLLYAAVRAGVQLRAYYVKTQFQPQFELEDARRLAEELRADWRILELDILALSAVAENPRERCYHCKKAIFSAIAAAARADGFPVVLDGTNASDDAGDRPGMRALAELQVLSPLRLCALTKEQVRALSKEAGLFTWDKPAYACLATRMAAGEAITAQKLAVTEAAENYLFSLGFRDFRIRLQNGAAKLELPEAQLPLLLEHRREILEKLKEHYTAVWLDLEVRK